MREKTPQDYARELIEMYRANSEQQTALPTGAAETSNLDMPPAEQASETVFEDGTGGLQLNVTTLQRLYPVKGALITVFTGAPDNMTVIETDTTDESGQSVVFNLKTPLKSQSQQYDADGTAAYAKYNVSVRSDGYVEQIAMNVPVFSGVLSVQGIDLLPISAAGGHTSTQIINEGNNYNL